MCGTEVQLPPLGPADASQSGQPETFGLSSSSVSRRYVKATARKLAEFQERSLEGHDLVTSSSTTRA